MLVWSSERPEIRNLAIERLKALGYETWDPETIAAAAVIRDRRVAALVVYSGYQRRYRAIEMSIIADSPRWATRPIIWALFTYPFEQLQLQRVSSAIRADNVRSIKLCEGLGFRQEGRIRLGYGDCDALVYGLLADEWRGGRYGSHGRRDGLRGGVREQLGERRKERPSGPLPEVAGDRERAAGAGPA